MKLVHIREKEKQEILEACTTLIRLNTEGRIRGLVFGIALDDGDYRIGVKGHSRAHPIEALGLFARGTHIANGLVTRHLQQLETE